MATLPCNQTYRTRDLRFNYEGHIWTPEQTDCDLDATWQVGSIITLDRVYHGWGGTEVREEEYQVRDFQEVRGILYALLELTESFEDEEEEYEV